VICPLPFAGPPGYRFMAWERWKLWGSNQRRQSSQGLALELEHVLCHCVRYVGHSELCRQSVLALVIARVRATWNELRDTAIAAC
jgi:hypothetical protein